MSMSVRGRESGLGLIEVLITLLIVLVGLLGMAGLHGRALTAQMEAYQRSQAIVIAKDMVGRINANRAGAAGYVTSTPLGTGNSAQPASCDGLTGNSLDLCEWHHLLLGAGETNSDGNNVGAMIGARGCVYQVAGSAPARYVVAVAWQGFNASRTPPTAVACGSGSYGSGAKHRVIAIPVTIATLSP